MVGAIYLANIYFTDAAASKVRPILLLRPNSFGDMLYMPLTSNVATKGISIDNGHLSNGYLPKASVIVYEKIGVISTVLLIKRIGTLHNAIYREVVAELVQFLQD
ncbi:MAG: type II toxin-antitoxin system PemK/MazF family toxin [Chitinophagaceae bacterium]